LRRRPTEAEPMIEGKTIAVALLADFNVDGDPSGEAQ
jgi:hypothetical protein